MHTIVLVWLLFSDVIAEPLFLHRKFLEAARRHPKRRSGGSARAGCCLQSAW
jgi:hypothetical protein